MSTHYKKVSGTGSITIPISVRREMGIEAKDPVEIEITNDNQFIIKPYQLRCNFCGIQEEVKPFAGKGICVKCAKAITKTFGGELDE